MAFSNSISGTTFDTRKVIDRAFGRCKMTPQQITAEHLEIAKDALFLMLSAWANEGRPLWCTEKQLYPLYDGVGQIATSLGTVDILDASFRTLSEATGTNTDAADRRAVEFEEETIVSTVGIKWSAASAPVEFARSDDGAAWTVVQTETPDAASGEWSWYDLDSVVASLHFRVRATSGNLDFAQIYLGNTPREIPLYRSNRDDYTWSASKHTKSSRVTEYWFDRQVRQPVLRLSPIPDSTAETSQLVVWRTRHIMDVGTLTQEIEVPQRWYDAVVAGLAAKLADEVAEVPAERAFELEPKAALALEKAMNFETDSSPVNISPGIGAYTA